MSSKRSQKLIQWLFTESGVRFLVHILGNHDTWNSGGALLPALNTTQVPMVDWSAKFQLVFPNDRRCRIWCSHDFPGNSQFNSLHGPQKAALSKDWAHLYVAGHKHNWAMHQEEHHERSFVYWLLRARGYKFHDSYADVNGFGNQEYGATVAAVINPKARDETSFVHCFAGLDEAADYLTFLRSRA